LSSEHLATDARIFATRRDLVHEFAPIAAGGIICEIGVEYGNFSEFLIDAIKPSQFWAFDLFDLHTYAGNPHAAVLGALTHEQFYRQRLARRRDTDVNVRVGDSSTRLHELPDGIFDLVYLDGDHRLEGVRRDTEQAVRTLKTSGVIVFNDYIMFDHIAKMPYGVVPVVNDLCARGGWKVVGFALQQGMFCDIAVRRAEAISSLPAQ